MSEKNKTIELNDEALEKVNGGSHMTNGRTYSDDTYAQLGFPLYGQESKNHPLIVTMPNTCSLSNVTCWNCPYRRLKFLTYYCLKRSEERDPAI